MCVVTYKLLFKLKNVLNQAFYYALMGGSLEAYGSDCLSICLFVHLSVCLCVILQRAFLCDSNELSNKSCNATAAQYSTTAKLARFLL